MSVKPIYITHEKGLDALAPHIAQALSEVMAAFPKSKKYDQHFPIINLGNWQAEDSISEKNGNLYYEPYKSIDWYIERAKQKASLDERWEQRGQISIDQLYQDLSNDPFAKKIPQFSILITRHDLYGTAPNGQLLNFCNGVTREGKFAIVSVARFLNQNNYLDLERFKTVVMHEFGHLIGLTPDDRKNSYVQLGTHCRNGDIMEQDMSGTGKIMTDNRLFRKANGLPPICSDCIEAGCRFLDREILNHHLRLNRDNRHL